MQITQMDSGGSCGRFVADESEETRRLINALVTVAYFLRTRYESKSHGGYDIYEDEQISIWLDTYVPNLSVKVLLDGEWKTVFFRSYSGPISSYRKGKWEQYVLMKLLPAAECKEEKQREELSRRERGEHERDFAPINDEKVFGAIVG